MDFLVHKFSEWLDTSNIPHELLVVKGGYIINFIEPDEDLKRLISSLFILIDTGKEELKDFKSGTATAVRTPLNIFTSSGDGIVIDNKYTGDILSTIQPIIRDYIIEKYRKKQNGGH